MLDSFLILIHAIEAARVSYCVIGGIAILSYGGRASTLDLDFYIIAKNRDRLRKVLGKLGAKVEMRGEFQYQGTFNGFRFDILIADRWVGLPALKRSKKIQLGNSAIQIATPEDLIIMKTLADRSIDRRDIEELREIFSNLDEKYINRRLKVIKGILK